MSLRDEIIQRISDEKHRICGHIPPLHDGGCGVCNLALFAKIEIVDLFKNADVENARLKRTKEYVDSVCRLIEKVRELDEIDAKMRPWTDEQAFNAFNRKITEAHIDACRELAVLIGKDNFNTLMRDAT